MPLEIVFVGLRDLGVYDNGGGQTTPEIYKLLIHRARRAPNWLPFPLSQPEEGWYRAVPLKIQRQPRHFSLETLGLPIRVTLRGFSAFWGPPLPPN